MFYFFDAKCAPGGLIQLLNTQLALREHDAKQLYMARQHLVDIKNIYAVLTDVIHKNIQKVGAIVLSVSLHTTRLTGIHTV
jgi:Proteasome activator PA28, C-terminal